MAGVRAWVRMAVCAGMLATGVAGLGLEGAEAQSQARPPAAPPLTGNIARGRYLVERVAMCGECHSTRDQAGVIVSDTFLMGGAMPAQVPWVADWPVQVPRIAGLPGYSDVEALHLLMDGAIKRNGIQARAPMPRFRMTRDDAADVIAFLRTQ